MTEQLRRQHIQALLEELEGYQRNLVRAERDDDAEQIEKWQSRVKVVEDSLRAHGHELKPKHQVAERRRGRPPGSRNRPKPEVVPEPAPEVKPEGEAVADGDQ